MKIKNIILTFSMLVSALAANAQADLKPVPDLEAGLATFQRSAEKIKTLKSEFSQVKHLAYLSVSVSSKGKYWFEKPGKMRWEYTEPYQYKILIINGHVTVDDQAVKQQPNANNNVAFDQLNAVMVSAVNGTLAKSEKFNLEMLENDEQILLKMHPKTAELKEVLKYMHLEIDKKSNTVSQIKMVEAQDDYTIITFENMQVNLAIPATIFK